MPEVFKVNVRCVARYQLLQLWSRKHFEPFTADDGLEAVNKGIRLFLYQDSHLEMGHQVQVTDPKHSKYLNVMLFSTQFHRHV